MPKASKVYLETRAECQMDNQIELRQELFSRIAKYEIMEVPDGQIVRALGLKDDKRLQQIRELPDYQAMVERLQIEALEQAQTLNQGWDAVEDEALGTVLETLRANPDPEFALRAAAMANKAVRRGNRGNQALPGGAVAATVINLSTTFVQRLQQLNLQVNYPAGVAGGASNDANGKRVDTLDPGSATRLLEMSEAESIAESIFADMQREPAYA